ncbi:MAG: efflux transporter outer membrane subunit [Caulobacteraceae bacterium]|nr:efflux transporter outer membrane subunit [Caulobacter sp.]
MTRLRRSRSLAALGAAAVLTGCTVGPDFHGPPPQAPAARFGAEPADTPSRTTGGAIDEAWWSSFGDPELSSLVERLARQNLDLKAAAERIVQARAARRIARAEGLPQVSGQAKYTRERESANGFASLEVPAPGAPLEFDLDDTSLQASWELDLFGRVRRAVEAADAGVQAQVQARRDLALTAVADLAQTYLQLRSIQAREAVVQRNLAAADVRRRLTRDRLRNGVATLSDIAQADAQAAAIGEDLPSLHQQDSQLINALGVLLALPPRALEAELRPPPGQPPAAQPGQPPRVPVGLPSELLRRRPDIRQAEANLHAATAETGVAVADFYPDVTLTGSYGNESLSTNHLFDYASRMFMAGPTVSLPIFQGGQLRGQLQLRRAQQREAALAYRRTVLQAWREVDDALTAYSDTQHRYGEIQHVRDEDRTALRVAEQRYVQGVENFIDVTAAQAAVFRDEDQLAQAQADISAALVRLYRALGGGWRSVEAVAPA